MTDTATWGRLQNLLKDEGYLHPEDVRVIRNEQDISPSLKTAIDAAGIHLETDTSGNPILLVLEVEQLENNVRLARKPFCNSVQHTSGMHVLVFGPSKGRWKKSNLIVTINTIGCQWVGPISKTPYDLIKKAFDDWQSISSNITFTHVALTAAAAQIADIKVYFTNNDGTINNKFGTVGGTVASGGFPDSSDERGLLRFDSTDLWSDVYRPLLNHNNLYNVALHELGHVLGLSHSKSQSSIMYPTIDTTAIGIDPFSIESLRMMYGWKRQPPLTDRGTSDAPALVSYFESRIDGTGSEFVKMVWKGIGDDHTIYESDLVGGWSPQRVIPGIGSSHSPAITEHLPLGDTASIPVMAWRGIGSDNSIFWSVFWNNQWTPQTRYAVGTSTRPTLASVNGKVYIAWKGLGTDYRIFWAKLNAWTNFGEQQEIGGRGTTDSPALVGMDTKLYMFWKGLPGDSHIYWAMNDLNGSGLWSEQKAIKYYTPTTTGGRNEFIGTSGGISAVRYGKNILLAWKGIEDDLAIYVSIMDTSSNEFGGQIQLEFGFGTSTSPSILNSLIAWRGTGDDNNIWWARLQK
ncbi:matrixin family metalloprotease [Paenibacillus anseongense]|uniref:matrixin family metalloprotease n=1 Tax=Paenibacillus anseongense TaxID=2682845 RepID=UPI002DB5ABB6|nr:matrixin family metalloprotease [Paenibacillus anseongense]MEC0268330.1 matrixin family metalloprotease [Paenibacillus anseongense]